ncbi:MAG: hypothetical protein WDN06_02130 [Asticcacaulis sp.]
MPSPAARPGRSWAPSAWRRTSARCPPRGYVSYDASKGAYSVTGGGRDIWAKSDDFFFVAKPATGDLTLAATLNWVTDSGDPHRKAGLMMRQSLNPDSPYVDIVVHGNHHVALQYRDTPGGETHEIEAILHGPGRMALEREGDYVYMSVAGPDGVLHHAGGGYRIHFDGPYYVGLVVCAHDDRITKTVDFRDVTMAAPAATPKPNLESTVETIDATTTYRAVVYQGAGRFTAPGWGADGKTITLQRQRQGRERDPAARRRPDGRAGAGNRAGGTSRRHLLSLAGRQMDRRHHPRADRRRRPGPRRPDDHRGPGGGRSGRCADPDYRRPRRHEHPAVVAGQQAPDLRQLSSGILKPRLGDVS